MGGGGCSFWQRDGEMESTFLSASSLALPQFHQSNEGIKRKV